MGQWRCRHQRSAVRISLSTLNIANVIFKRPKNGEKDCNCVTLENFSGTILVQLINLSKNWASIANLAPKIKTKTWREIQIWVVLLQKARKWKRTITRQWLDLFAAEIILPYLWMTTDLKLQRSCHKSSKNSSNSCHSSECNRLWLKLPFWRL